MNFKGIIMSERSRSQRWETHCIILSIWDSRKGKTVVTEDRLVTAGDWVYERGYDWKGAAQGGSGGDGGVLYPDCGNGTPICKCAKQQKCLIQKGQFYFNLIKELHKLYLKGGPLRWYK